MPWYEVSVPIAGFIHMTVEAKDEDQAEETAKAKIAADPRDELISDWDVNLEDLCEINEVGDPYEAAEQMKGSEALDQLPPDLSAPLKD